MRHDERSHMYHYKIVKHSANITCTGIRELYLKYGRKNGCCQLQDLFVALLTQYSAIFGHSLIMRVSVIR